MSKLNIIEAKLKEIEQGKFQKLGDSFFYKIGYERITPWGSVIGKDKTKPGVPDTYIELDNGKYIFIEYTTQQDKVFDKFTKDINKDLDENITGIPVKKIEKIVIFFNSKLSLSQTELLKNICNSYGVKFESYNISRISLDLLNRFPSIAKEFLHVHVDTNQILSLDDFIQEASNKPFTPSLDNKFLFR